MLSEQYRIKGEQWAKLAAAAQMLEEGKSAYLAQQVCKQGDIAYNQAEKNVKASKEWADYIKNMVLAKEVANLARIEMDALRMQHSEQMSLKANKRAESKL